MASQGRTLLILAGVLAAGVAAAVWLAMSDDGGASRDDTSAVAADAAPKQAAASAQPAQRSRRQGTAGVFGEIRRTVGKAPVAGQEVLLAPERGEPFSVTTDAQGAFRFEKIPHGGPYELSAAAKGCGTIRITGIALDRNEVRNVGTLFLDPAVKLSVLVHDNADRPLEGAVVEAFAIAQYVDWDWTKALAQLGQVPIAVSRATTDPHGEAVFPEITVGRWTFSARKEGFAPGGVRWVSLRPDQEPKPVTIWLSPGHPLDGRVFDADRKPVEGALVMAGSPNAGWDSASAPLRTRATTDAEGRYAFVSLESGETQLWVGRGATPPAPVATLVVPRVPHFDIQLPGTGRLAGTVTAEADGKPVEGAAVLAQCWEEGVSRVAQAVTDADGKYAMELTAGTVNRLTVEKAGLVQARDPGQTGNQRVATIRVGETTAKDVRMRRAARLTGVVKGPDGALAGARVTVYFGRANEGFQQKSATTGADGAYEFASLETGTVMVTASKEGYWLDGEPANWWQDLQSPGASKELKVEIGESADAKHDVELKAGSVVEGVVLGPDGNPLAGARVSSWPAPEIPPTGADGKFRLGGVKPGAAVSLYATKDGYRMAAAKPIAVLAGETATGITLRMLTEARVRGKVTSGSGAPVAEARVLLARKNPGPSQPWEEQSRWQGATRVPVKPDGTYDAAMPFSGPGQLLVRATALDQATADAAPIEITEGRESYDVDLVLGDGADIEGRVVVKGGDTGIAGARVSVTARGGNENAVVYGWSGGTPAVWAVTDATGAFRVAHLAATAYEVRAAADGYVSDVAATKAGADKPLVVELAPELTIEGVVAYADGSPVEGAEVQASNGQGQTRTFGGMAQGPRSAVTDKAGAFRVAGVAGGNWALDVRAPWGSELNIRAKRVDGVAGGAKDVRVVVEAGGTIAGRVADSQGKPVAAAWVNANPMPKQGVQLTGNEWRYAQSRADGTFTITGLGDGLYHVQVNANNGTSGYRPAQADDVAVGTKDLAFTLEPGLSITGTICDPDGKPVAQMQVQANPVDPQGGRAQSAGAMTDGEGRFTFSGLAPGDYRIEAPQWGGPAQAWTLDARTTYPAGTSDLRLTVTKGVTISGFLVDDGGAAVTQGWVSATTPKGGQRYGQPKGDGTFEIGGLQAGERYTLNAQAQGRVNAVVEDVAAGATDVRIVLAKGLEASGSLVDASGKAMPNVQVSFTHADGRHRQWTQTGTDGRFTASGLVEGSYEAKAWVQPDPAKQGEWKAAGTIRAGDRGAELRVQ